MKFLNDVLLLKRNELPSLLKWSSSSSLREVFKKARKGLLLKKINSIYYYSEVKGKRRVRSYKKLFSITKDTSSSVVEVKENNIKVVFDFKKVYYDLTYSNERSLLSKRIKEIEEGPVDILYGGIGILGFYLSDKRIVTIVDNNPYCKDYFEKSLLLQKRIVRQNTSFILSTVHNYLRKSTSRIMIAVAPLIRNNYKAYSRTYDHIFFYQLINKVEVLVYLEDLKKVFSRVEMRIAKEYSNHHNIYLIQAIK